MASVWYVEPPTPEKARLILEFLRLSGLQAKIDSGDVVDHLISQIWPAFRSAPLVHGTFISAPRKAFDAAYASRRQVWQDEYENHMHQTFDENELSAMNAFFASPVGQRYVDDQWRMKAFISSNTEDIQEEIVAEACAAASTLQTPPRGSGGH